MAVQVKYSGPDKSYVSTVRGRKLVLLTKDRRVALRRAKQASEGKWPAAASGSRAPNMKARGEDPMHAARSGMGPAKQDASPPDRHRAPPLVDTDRGAVVTPSGTVHPTNAAAGSIPPRAAPPPRMKSKSATDAFSILAEEAAAIAEAEAAEEAAAAGDDEDDDDDAGQDGAAAEPGASPGVGADYIPPGAPRPDDPNAPPEFDAGVTGEEMLAMLTGAYAGVICLGGEFIARMRGTEPREPSLKYPKPDGTIVEVKLETAMQRCLAAVAIKHGWNNERFSVSPEAALVGYSILTIGIMVIGATPTAETAARRDAEERARTAGKRAEEAEALHAAEVAAHDAEERLRAAQRARDEHQARRNQDVPAS